MAKGMSLYESCVQVWKSSPMLAAMKGFKVVFSTCWYLDHQKNYLIWANLYECDPLTCELPPEAPVTWIPVLNHNVYFVEDEDLSVAYGVGSVNYTTSDFAANIIGGEACMWTEYQSDDSILQRIWFVLGVHIP
ncbi:hypothetical protein Ciccas_000241 [Cichlidogyrus casuarinus]|uniref:beta-N-acetylhexosaminidase n=1 Tax=Cichlidogyrus casuarinus TaxID=1844966 RepID=A0ABD2QNI4_9PLAT